MEVSIALDNAADVTLKQLPDHTTIYDLKC
jgi:hypothetical protein